MKILNDRPVLTPGELTEWMLAGWDWADITGRTHRTKVMGAEDHYALMKEMNGSVILIPYGRILDLHRQEVTV